jgi:hypothetical protein
LRLTRDVEYRQNLAGNIAVRLAGHHPSLWLGALNALARLAARLKQEG